MELLSYGGGVQSVAMVVLVVRGELPLPDAVIIADTGREMPSTFEYAREHVIPLLSSIGLQLHVAGHDLASVDLYAHNGDLLLPVFTQTGKMQAFCSSEWKARVVDRYVRRQLGWTGQYLTWIGYSLDERRRARPDPARRYPLLELSLTRADCERIIIDAGLPLPSKSRCYICPHQSPDEWMEVRADSGLWKAAVEVDEEVAAWDDTVYLHQSRKRLRDLNDDDMCIDDKVTYRQCGLGMCYL
jgi:hypothetical protein